MKTVYLFLAEGFEEIEALTPVDILRRAGIEIKTVGLPAKTVLGAHGIPVIADLEGSGFSLPEDAAMVILPGGGTGTANLKESAVVEKALMAAQERGLYIAAICAAPTVLEKYGILNGKTMTAFPSVKDSFANSHYTGAPVETDGRIITGRSAGVALAFAHQLAVLLAGKETADKVVQSVYPDAVI